MCEPRGECLCPEEAIHPRLVKDFPPLSDRPPCAAKNRDWSQRLLPPHALLSRSSLCTHPRGRAKSPSLVSLLKAVSPEPGGVFGGLLVARSSWGEPIPGELGHVSRPPPRLFHYLGLTLGFAEDSAEEMRPQSWSLCLSKRMPWSCSWALTLPGEFHGLVAVLGLFRFTYHSEGGGNFNRTG